MLSSNKFRANLKYYIDKTVENHEPLKVSRKNGGAFVVLSLEDYEREQETLYILNNNALMGQIETSFATYQEKSGYRPSAEALNFDGNY